MKTKHDKKLPWPDAPGLWWATRTKDGERVQVWAARDGSRRMYVIDARYSWWQGESHCFTDFAPAVVQPEHEPDWRDKLEELRTWVLVNRHLTTGQINAVAVIARIDAILSPPEPIPPKPPRLLASHGQFAGGWMKLPNAGWRLCSNDSVDYRLSTDFDIVNREASDAEALAIYDREMEAAK